MEHCRICMSEVLGGSFLKHLAALLEIISDKIRGSLTPTNSLTESLCSGKFAFLRKSTGTSKSLAVFSRRQWQEHWCLFALDQSVHFQ